MVHGSTWASKSVYLVMTSSCNLEHLVITSIRYVVFSMGWFWISWNECVFNIIWWLIIELGLHAWSDLCEYGHICWNQLMYKHKVLLEGVEWFLKGLTNLRPQEGLNAPIAWMDLHGLCTTRKWRCMLKVVFEWFCGCYLDILILLRRACGSKAYYSEAFWHSF